MYTVTATALPTLPTTPPTSVASMIAPGEPVLGRLPVTPVAGAVADPAIRNEAQNNPPYVLLAAQDMQAAATDSAAAAAQNSDTSISAFPSLFLAQLMGQGPGDTPTQNLIASYNAPQSAAQPQQAATPANADLSGQYIQALKENGATHVVYTPPAPQVVTQPVTQAVQAPTAPQPERKTQVKATEGSAQAKKLQAYQVTAARGAAIAAAEFSPAFA